VATLITSLDTLIAAFVPGLADLAKNSGSNLAAGTWHSTWYLAGTPAAGSAPTGGLNGVTFSGTVTGQVPIPAAASGKQIFLSRVEVTPIGVGNIAAIEIIDRLWGDVPVVTTTTGQAVTSPTWPSRDANGATTGAKVKLAFEVSSALGNGAPITNTTVAYTNSSGTGSRTGTVASFPASASAGTWIPVTLAAGDDGVQSVQTITLGTSYVSGAMHLIAYRTIARIPLAGALVAVDRSAYQLDLPPIYDSSVLQMLYLPTSTTFGAMYGSLAYAQG
jgi:hypothetical protein